MIRTEKFMYGNLKNNETFEGSISFDDANDSKRPGILVCHAYGGHSDFEIKKSEELATLGYFAFAIDIYGQGKRGSNPPLHRQILHKKRQAEQKIEKPV